MKTAPIILVALMLAACGERPTETADVEPTPQAPVAAPPSLAAGTPPTYSATPAPDEALPPSQTTPGPIPLEFRHVWAIEAADCTKEPALTRIVIAPGAVKFYEGRSEVVSANAPHQGALTMEVTHSSEGTMAEETHTLALDDTGKKLTYKRRGAEYIYTRCD
jgi:hypothetical protein